MHWDQIQVKFSQNEHGTILSLLFVAPPFMFTGPWWGYILSGYQMQQSHRHLMSLTIVYTYSKLVWTWFRNDLQKTPSVRSLVIKHIQTLTSFSKNFSVFFLCYLAVHAQLLVTVLRAKTNRSCNWKTTQNTNSSEYSFNYPAFYYNVFCCCILNVISPSLCSLHTATSGRMAHCSDSDWC